MSNLRQIFQSPSNLQAETYNAQQAERHNYPATLPAALLKAYPKLERSWAFGESHDAVREEVYRLQRDLGFPPEDCDGMYGPATAKAAAKRFAPVERALPPSTPPHGDEIDHLIWSEVRRPCSRRKTHATSLGAVQTHGKIVGLDAPDALSLHRTGSYRAGPRRSAPKLIVLHWGGRSAKNLHSYFAATDRSVSSHGGVDPTGAYQFLDFGVESYHAGSPWNQYSVGFDVAQSPEAKHASFYADLDLQPISNPDLDVTLRARTFDPILPIHPETARHMRHLVFHTLAILGLEPKVPRFAQGETFRGKDVGGRVKHELVSFATWQKEGYTVLGHHHLSSQKSDIIGWWQAIFAGTPLGDL